MASAHELVRYRFDNSAQEKVGRLDGRRRARVCHVLGEIAAVHGLERASSYGSLEDEVLHLHVAGLRVRYRAVGPELIVHDIDEDEAAMVRAG